MQLKKKIRYLYEESHLYTGMKYNEKKVKFKVYLFSQCMEAKTIFQEIILNRLAENHFQKYGKAKRKIICIQNLKHCQKNQSY